MRALFISLTGNSDNKDVYIKRSYRKDNGKTATQIYRKLGKLNDLLDQFSGDYDAMMAWARAEAEKDTIEYNAKTSSVTVSLSKCAYIPKNEERCLQVGYLFLQKLFMDPDGIPLAFDVFPGNQNEQTTLKPLETKVIRDFACSEFIFCSDAGLGNRSNRRFNSFGKRSYVITQSLKKMRGEDRQADLNPKNFHRPGSDKLIDISALDESDPDIYETVFYKEGKR